MRYIRKESVRIGKNQLEKDFGQTTPQLDGTLVRSCNVPNRPQKEGPQQCFRGTFPYFVDERIDREDMYQRNIYGHGPVNVALIVVVLDDTWYIHYRGQ